MRDKGKSKGTLIVGEEEEEDKGELGLVVVSFYLSW